MMARIDSMAVGGYEFVFVTSTTTYTTTKEDTEVGVGPLRRHPPWGSEGCRPKPRVGRRPKSWPHRSSRHFPFCSSKQDEEKDSKREREKKKEWCVYVVCLEKKLTKLLPFFLYRWFTFVQFQKREQAPSMLKTSKPFTVVFLNDAALSKVYHTMFFINIDIKKKSSKNSQ